ncbi:hypothetical protein NDN08_007630 [Rhodosorus marinus]|uniref:Protein kinase domain-containing protein n=1 Tax=Rhodosorus marinus TaxID=101924 RepID=A0AAV8UY37_9RHOD|nr:hypothetical protein NDN08_007630 [Rhodosorus marinus]
MALGEGSLLAATAPAPKEWTPFQNSCDLCAPSFSVPSWRFLGRGGSGVVYAATCEGGDQPFVVKISSAQSWRQVALEFDVIQRLSSAKVPNIETPIRLLDASPSGSKVVAAVYYPEANGNLTGSLFDTMDPSIKARAAKAIGETVGAMLCEGIVCVDLQFLLDTDSGRLLVIDLTESLVLSHQPTAIDLSFVQSFLLESRSLIPDSLFPAAQQAAQMEFSRRFPKASRNYLESPEMSDVLLSSEWEFETR